MMIEWWHWAVLGFVLVVAELMVPAFVLLWFGVAAFAVAGLTWFVPGVGLAAQLITLVVAAGALIALWFRVVRPGRHKTQLGMADAGFIGQVAMVVEEVEPFKRGRVRFQRPFLGADTWECIADESIPAGERVKVKSVEGSLLKVEKN